MSWVEIGETTLYQARMLQRHYRHVATLGHLTDATVRIGTQGKSGYWAEQLMSEKKPQTVPQKNKVAELIAASREAQEFLAGQNKRPFSGA